MAVIRVAKTRDYTVMSNRHLKDKSLTLKAKGLLTLMLSLPDEWNFTTRGLAAICTEGVDSIGAGLTELEQAGYMIRHQLRDGKGKITDTEHLIYETLVERAEKLDTVSPCTENPDMDKPDMDAPGTEKPAQLNTKEPLINYPKFSNLGNLAMKTPLEESRFLEFVPSSTLNWHNISY